MRRTLLAAAVLAGLPSLGLGCVLEPQPPGWRDARISVAADCSYTGAGDSSYRDISGEAPVAVGAGLIAYEVSEIGACELDGHLVVVDCNSGETIGIQGISHVAGTMGTQSVAELFPPKGGIRLNSRTTVAKLAEVSRRRGYTHWLDVPARIAAQKPGNRANPYCGCKLFYPDSEHAKND